MLPLDSPTATTVALTEPPRVSGHRRPRIVALGGGTGLPQLLRGLKRAYFGTAPAGDLMADRDLLTAIVTVTDDGGSSGRLRQQFQGFPPGDIRNCLLALADADSRVSAIFDFRFPGTSDVGGHSLGNLILTALGVIEDDFHAGVQYGAALLGVRGKVLPATLGPVTLNAELDDGCSVQGESAIAGDARLIRHLTLNPANTHAPAAAMRAIEEADLVVLAPGSLYTSLIAVLLVKDIADTLARARVPTILVMNLMTQPGETDGYTAADHVVAIRKHAPAVRIRDILLHPQPLPLNIARDYASRGSKPVSLDRRLLTALGYRTVERDLLGAGPKIRHDPDKLAKAIIECAKEPLV